MQSASIPWELFMILATLYELAGETILCSKKMQGQASKLIQLSFKVYFIIVLVVVTIFQFV